MNENIKVSVVILPCRHPRMIKESFSKQTLKEIEILETDPVSALSKAHGKYILFADIPCIAEPEALEKMYGFAEENGCEVTVASADLYNICKEKYTVDRRFLNLSYFGGRNIILRGDGKNAIMNFTSPVTFNKLFRTDSVRESGLLNDGLDRAFFVYSMITSAEKTGGIDEVLFHKGIDFKDGEWEELPSPEDFVRDFERLESYFLEKDVFEGLSFSFFKCFSAEFAYLLRRSVRDGSSVELCRTITGSSLWEKYQERIREDLGNDENALMLISAPSIVKTHDMYFVPRDYEAPIIKAGKEPSDEPLVSVVIPAYNVEEYVESSVRCVLEQSLENIEIICIDDGSTDSTLDILMRLAEEDKRIRVYSQPNSGLSMTRNVGIGLSSGRYIYFLDSDDLILPETLKDLSDQMDKDDLDILIFNYFECFSEDEDMETYINNGMMFYRRNGVYPPVCDGVRFMSELLKREEYFPGVHGQIYRRSYLERINAAFVPGIIHEDNLFTFTTILSCHACGYSNGRYYRRRYRKDSIMTNNVSFKNCFGYFYSYVRCNEFVNRNIPEVTAEVNEVILRIFNNAVINQMRLPPEEKYFFYGLKNDMFKIYSGMIFKQAEFTNKENELRKKLQLTYDEKSEINRKLQTAYEEKSELNKKLQRTYEEKSEINRKLQDTYEEKSELNKKLQRTYGEKSERGRIIREQEGQIEKLKKQNKELQNKVKSQKAEIKNLSEKMSNKIIRKAKKLLKKR